MLLNQNTAVVTPKVLLVPYEAHHVPTYHDWMKCPEIQKLTASEPLSMEEEYAMQASWRKDVDKLTFIICRPTSLSRTSNIVALSDDAPEKMIGDVNLFLTLAHDEDSNGNEIITAPRVNGELELMIATKENRGKGYGRDTLDAFLQYIKIHELVIIASFADAQIMDIETVSTACMRGLELGVKVGKENQTSRGLFESVGFEQVGEVNYFGEVELKLKKKPQPKEGEEAEEDYGVEGWSEVAYVRTDKK